MKLFALFFLLLLPTSAEDIYDPNSFVRAFNIWASQTRSVTSVDIINAAEVLQWQRVKSEWHALERHVDQHYGSK